MTIVRFGWKRGRLGKPKNIIPTVKHRIMFWGCFAAGGTGALHKIDGIIEATSQDVRKLKLGHKWVFQMDNELNPIENLWAELKRRVRARRPTNLTQLHQLCQEEWAKIHPTYCGKLVEGYPKRLTQVKQFEGNATKY